MNQGLESIDQLFAETILRHANLSSKKWEEFLSRFFLHCREGHFCQAIEEAPPDELVARVPEEPPNKPFCLYGKALYLQKNWTIETKIVSHLERLRLVPPLLSVQLRLSLETLNAEQQVAVKNSFQHPLSVISGGPGTGKSYTATMLIRAFLDAVQEREVSLVVAAPTGKAAMRLQAALPPDPRIRCGTIHRLFSQIAVSDADLILIDESSMIDGALFSHLLSLIKTGARLILMGDPDQLPAVEPGSPFIDLMEAIERGYSVPRTHLTQVVRSDQKEILDLSREIAEGKIALNRIKPLEQFRPDAFIAQFLIGEKDPFKQLQIVSRLCLLSAVRDGPFGVEEMNRQIFSEVVLKTQAVPILITKTDHDRALYNGEVGILQLKNRSCLIHPDNVAFFAKGEAIPSICLPSFELAYCLSVHKSQGSEYEKVVLLLPPGSEAFGRELLYTAATRAKKEIEIFGEGRVASLMAKKRGGKESRLSERLVKP